jgi:hypothetical protein
MRLNLSSPETVSKEIPMSYGRDEEMGRSDQRQQLVVNPSHVGTLLFYNLEPQNTFVVPGYVPVWRRNSGPKSATFETHIRESEESVQGAQIGSAVPPH